MSSYKEQLYDKERFLSAAYTKIAKLEAENRVLREGAKKVANQIVLSSYACAGNPELQDQMKMYAIWAGELDAALKAADEIERKA